MQTLETIKTKSQATMNNLLEKGKEQPEEMKTWGITAGSAVVGAVAVTAAAKGVVALFTAIASPPLALALGAVGGGALSWNFMQRRHTEGATEPPTATETAVSLVEESTSVPAASTIPATPEPLTVATATSVAAPTDIAAAPNEETGTDNAAVVTALVEEAPLVASTMVTEISEANLDADTAAVADVAAIVDLEAATASIPELVTAPTAEIALPDDLEAINGIGPVYAGRLRTAGIETFAQLAELTPERIQEIIGAIRSGHMIEAEKWIAEARQFIEHGRT